MYYIGENTIDLIIKLIDEIEEKKEIINADYKKLKQYSKIKNMLDKTSNYENISKEDYGNVISNIKSLNIHKYYGRINDNEISTFFCDLIDLEDENSNITNIYTYKQKITDISLFTIPIVNETNSIYMDNNYVNTYISVYSKYDYLIKLKDVMAKYNKLKKLIDSKNIKNSEREKYKYQLKECSIQMRTLKNIILDFYKENPDIENYIKSNIKTKGKITWIDMIKYSVVYFEKIYIPNTLKQLYEELKIKNEKSINYGNTINNCLIVKTENIGNDILDTSTFFKEGYILKYIDSIYPGLREERELAHE